MEFLDVQFYRLETGLLVVLVVIALFAGMIMMTITPNDNRTLDREAKRLMHIIQLAQDEAIMQGVELGLTVLPTRYSFSRLQNNNWVLLTADREFKQYDLNPAIEMTLQVEDENIVQQIDKEAVLPSIMILSSGELTAFKLALITIENSEKEVIIIGQENGQLSLQLPNE